MKATARVWNPKGERFLAVRPLETAHHGASVEVLPGGGVPVEGLGGALNEVGAQALFSLPADARAALLNDLFGAGGLGLDFNRLPIGASDFALDAYSLADVPGDLDLKHFSLERDEKLLLPFARAVLGVNPAARFWASPWSPPGWMKTTGRMEAGGELLPDPAVRIAYAQYLAKFVTGYQERGVPIAAVAVQNETDVINRYPTATMAAGDLRDFLRAYLIPEMVRATGRALATKVWVGTLRDVPGYADTVLADPVVRNLASGIGFQYSTEPVVTQAAQSYPKHRVYHTESPCHNGENSLEEAHDIFDEAVMMFRSGASNYCYWNLILDERKISTWDWNQNSLITIDRTTGVVTKNPEYQVLAALRKAAPTGSWTRTTKALGVSAQAFEERGTVRVALGHRGPGTLPVAVLQGGARWVVEVPAGGVAVVALPS